jgi:hypothetical protein
MNPTRGWDTTQAYEGDFERLPAGGYVCDIKAARVEPGKYGEQMLICLDISEGDKARFFGKMYERKKQRDIAAKWPCVFYQSTTDRDGNTNGFFKGLISAVEKSNAGYTWDWDERKLMGKKVGFLFREEEFIGQQDGKPHTIVKPFQARSVDVIREGVPVPEPKPLSGNGGAAGYTQQGFIPANEEPLPF